MKEGPGQLAWSLLHVCEAVDQPYGRPAQEKFWTFQEFHTSVTRTPTSGLEASTIMPPPMYMEAW